MDPNLLSAENYYNSLLEASSSKADQENQEDRSQWLGGLLANRSSNSKSVGKSASVSTKARRTSKEEALQSTSPDGSNGIRQRGRPRLDTRDQNAAERRRTQIRLAQRAYRQRKETTISGLNQRVMALEHTIAKMNKAFLGFNDKAIASGIGNWEPQLAHDLKTTMESFIESARCMEIESESEGGENIVAAPNISTRVFEAQGEHPSVVPGGPALRQTGTAQDATIAALLGYDPTPQPIEKNDIQGSQKEADQAVIASNSDFSDWHSSEPLRQYRVEVPHHNIDLKSLAPASQKSSPLPSSYHFQETSFARRLLRVALEGAYRLLSSRCTRSEDLLRFCQSTFSWTNRHICLRWLEKALAKTALDSLEYWGAPQPDPRGAGPQSSRTGSDIGSRSSPEWATNASMGPLPFMGPESPLDEFLGSADMTKRTGLGEEWFDSNDVEQYLQTKGLFLDGQSAYVELNADLAVEQRSEASVPMTASPAQSSRDSSGCPQSPPYLLLDGPVLEENAYIWNDEISMMPSFDGMNTGSFLDIPQFSTPKGPNYTEYFQSIEQPLRIPSITDTTRKYIDVEKFIITIMQSAVCLGRTPGFRRSAVDAALEAAIHVRF